MGIVVSSLESIAESFAESLAQAFFSKMHDIRISNFNRIRDVRKEEVNGGTLLHTFLSPECMNCPTSEMVEDMEKRNYAGETALHVMIRKKLLSCAVELLYHGACVDARDPHENTPLHLAIKGSSLSLVQALIVFGADLNARNKQGESARHLAATGEDRKLFDPILFALHAAGAERCPKTMHRRACAEGCAANGRFDGIPPTDFYENAKTMLENVVARDPGVGLRVLCLDGGGIRGLVLVQMLEEMEKLIGRPILQCFDFVAGTSTGAILALALATGKTLRECRCLYFRMNDKVFSGTRPYSSKKLEQLLQETLGKCPVMDFQKPRLMITATNVDRWPAYLHIFRNYKSPDKELPDTTRERMWEAARASGAAPSYFDQWRNFLDGGLICNNPTLDAFTEISQCKQAARDKKDEGPRPKRLKTTSPPPSGADDLEEVWDIRALVSLGTGRYRGVSDGVPYNFVWPISKPALVLDAINTYRLLSLLTNQATESNGRVTARALALFSELRIPYCRLNPQLTQNVALNETKNEKLVEMLWETTAYMRSPHVRKELLALKTILNA